jgi:Ca2+-dependent lipid-binding protein
MGLCSSNPRGPEIKPFKVFVRHAKDLVKMDMFSHADPYVKIKCLDMRTRDSKKPWKPLQEIKGLSSKTSMKKNKKNPEWNEVFVMNNVPANYTRLQLSVWDSDTLSGDDFMGKCEIDLGKWDMVSRSWIGRVDNELLSASGMMELPVDKVDMMLFPEMNKKGKPKSKVRGSLTFQITRERITEGRFMN